MIPFDTVLSHPKHKSLPKDPSVWESDSFFPDYFWEVAVSLFYLSAPAKLKIVGVRSVRSDVSVPFTDCPSNRGHSEYYLCQTLNGNINY